MGAAREADRAGKGLTAQANASEAGHKARPGESPPVILDRPAVDLSPTSDPEGVRPSTRTPENNGKVDVHTGSPHPVLELPAARPETRAARRVYSPLDSPSLTAEQMGEKKSITAFTGARLVSDPTRLAAVLQANLHAREQPALEQAAPSAPVPAMPDKYSGTIAVSGDVSFTPPAAPGSLRPALASQEEEMLGVLTPGIEPLDSAQLQRMVDEQFTRWLEDIELAYLRTYGTSGI
jgi:hypothetical protein